MKTAVAALVLLIAIVVGGLFAAPLLVDANDYRDEIAAEATRLTGHAVAIEGAVAFRVLPSPHFRAEALRIAGHANLPSVLTARAMDVRLSLRDLLGGRIAVDSVVLVEPVLALATAGDGRRNVDLARLQALPETDLTVRRLTVVDGRLEWRDARTGAAYRVTALAAEIEARSLAGPFELQGEGNVGDERLAFSGSVGRLDGNARLAVELDAPTLGKASLRGNFRTGDRFAAGGRLAVETPDLYHALARLAGRTGTEDDAAPVAARLEGRFGYEAERLAVEALTFKAGSLEGSGRLELTSGATPRLGLRLGFEQVAESELAGHVAALGAHFGADAKASLPTSLDVNLRVDAGVVSFGRGYLRQFALDADLTRGTLAIRRVSALLPGGSDFAFTGQLRAPGGTPRLDGSLEMVSDNLRALLDWAGVPAGVPASDRFRHASMTAAINANEDVLQVFDIDLRLDQSRFAGGVAVALRRRPSFSADLAVDRINADAYLEAFGIEGLDAWPMTDGGAPDLGLLERFDTNLRLRVDRLVAGQAPLDDVSLDVGLLGGRLTLNEFTIGRLGGARVRLAGTLDEPARPQFSGTLTVAGPDTASFLSSLGSGRRGMADGLGAFDAEIRFEGGMQTLGMELSGSADRLTVAANGSISDWLATPRFDLDLSLSSPSLVRLAGLTIPSWPLPSRLGGEAVFEGHVAGTPDAFALKGRLDALAARLELDGRHHAGNDGSGFEGRLRFRHGDVAGLVQRLAGPDITVPPDGGAIEADAGLRLGPDSIELADVELTGEAVQLAGDLKVVRRPLRPDIELRLTEAHVDADRFVPRPDDQAPRWPRTPLELIWLNDVDAAIELADTTILARGYGLEEATATARLSEGTLRLERLAGRLFGGMARAEGSLRGGASPALNLELTLEEAAAEEVLRAAADVAPLSGPVDLALELSAAGVTPFDMLRAADGRIRLEGGPLIVRGLDLDALRIGGAQAPWPEGISGFENLEGNWLIDGGTVRAAQPTQLTFAGGEGELRGSIDLERWAVDLEQRVTLETPDGRRTFRLSLSGPLEQPQKRVLEAETN